MEAQGAVFKSSKPLGFMADLIIRIECPALECECRAMTVEGIVVGCEESGDGWFEITVHFLQEENFDFAEPAAWSGLVAVNPLLN
jgi:murein endopeptidase